MKSITLTVISLLAAAFGTMQEPRPNQQVLFEKPLALEDEHAKLPEAIVLYRKIVYESGDKALAAQAQLRIGICHRKLGAKEAQSAFQKVIDQYPDQTEAVRLARSSSRCCGERRPRLRRRRSLRFVWCGPGRRPAALSHLRLTGEHLSFVDWSTGDLAVRDLETGKNRRVTNKGSWEQSSENALDSIWSPDGKQIAAVIGAASSYTPELFSNLIDFRDGLDVEQVTLMDPNLEKVSLIAEVSRRLLEESDMGIKVMTTQQRKEAIAEADFIFLQIRVGGLATRIRDERLPMEFGLVGNETTGAGGFVCALRTVPIAVDIARDIEQSAPKAWLMNLSNPAGIVTEAILNHTRVHTIGFCDIPINTQYELSKELGLNDEAVLELMAVVDLFSGLNKLMDGLRVELDEKPWYG